VNGKIGLTVPSGSILIKNVLDRFKLNCIIVYNDTIHHGNVAEWYTEKVL